MRMITMLGTGAAAIALAGCAMVDAVNRAVMPDFPRATAARGQAGPGPWEGKSDEEVHQACVQAVGDLARLTARIQQTQKRTPQRLSIEDRTRRDALRETGMQACDEDVARQIRLWRDQLAGLGPRERMAVLRELDDRKHEAIRRFDRLAQDPQDSRDPVAYAIASEAMRQASWVHDRIAAQAQGLGSTERTIGTDSMQ